MFGITESPHKRNSLNDDPSADRKSVKRAIVNSNRSSNEYEDDEVRVDVAAIEYFLRRGLGHD